MQLNEATVNPCNQCPWRRKSVRGFLGPSSASWWLHAVHTDEPIACHLTVKVEREWAPGTLQCRGAAIFRKHIRKLPRNREIAVGPKDRVTVFATDAEFLKHHDPEMAIWLKSLEESK